MSKSFTYDISALEQARAKRGLTKTKLCAIVSFHPSAYTRILTGRTRNPETIKKFADALGLDMEDLVVSDEQVA